MWYLRVVLCGGVLLKIDRGTSKRDLSTLADIVRGPGMYATPSPERVERLVQNGLVKKKNGKLRATFKGRLIALLRI